MPRRARAKSESGYYHILLRGIGRQNLFEDSEDHEKFLEILAKYKDELKYQIAAYCLMSNHVHLLLEDTGKVLDLLMKKIAGSYAYYFNWKYDRIGHLFQDRFKSEPVEDDAYFLTVMRYIHQNPLKAGIAQMDDYPWSSYRTYIEGGNFVDTEKALEIFKDSEQYIEFMSANETSLCLELADTHRLTDDEAIEIIRRTAKTQNAQAIQKFSIEQRNKALHDLKEQGISIRQLSRLTGINRGIILRA